MSARKLRRLLFDNLIFNLALLLGTAEAGLIVWGHALLSDGKGIGVVAGFALFSTLVAANALTVPSLRRTRRREDWKGTLARAYIQFGISTLLAGFALGIAGLAWLPVRLVSALVGAGSAPGVVFFEILSVLLVGFVVIALAWGFTIGQAIVDRTHLRVAIDGLHEDLAGLRIVQISDLHIGNGLEYARLDRMVERTNALDPDVLVLTGDIFDFDPDHVEDGARRLSRLRARHGVYAVLGNHDTYTGVDLVVDALARHAPNIRLLRDEIVRLPVDKPLFLAGVEDPGHSWSARGVHLDGLARVGAARPSEGPVVLLVHRPEAFAQAEALGFPLILTGHTHGGQLALPTPGGRYNLARIVSPFTRGVYRKNGTTMYVNRGIGVGGPALRINCSREIATIELQTA